MAKKHFIIFSHGFGVKKDSRGLFTDIASSLKKTEIVMFDYNTIKEKENKIIVKSFSQQAKILKKVIHNIKKVNQDSIIDIVCHSQGGVIVALAKPLGIRKIIMLAPPFDLNIEKMVNIFESRPGTKINMNGISRLARRDGSTTIVPLKYWVERKKVKPILLYKSLANKTELIIINAKQGDVLSNVSKKGLDNIRIINLNGNHNFDNKDRKKLIEVVAKLLVDKKI